MKCKRVRWLLALYGSGELSPEEQEMVETHLASCERCRQEVAQLSEVPALIQSLHGDTWWADVSSPMRERLNASGVKSGPSKAKPIKDEKKGMMREIPVWRPERIGSLAAAIMERPVWQPVLVSLLAVIIVVGASLAVMHPWAGDNMGQAAAELARDNPQVQVILGEEEIETEVVLAGAIAQVRCSTEAAFVTAVVNTENMWVMAIHGETIDPSGLPIFRPELTEDEKVEAIAIAEADSNVQRILSHGFALGEPTNSHPTLGADIRRVAWMPLKGGSVGGEVRGVVVDLDDRDDVTVIWGGDLPSWWPY